MKGCKSILVKRSFQSFCQTALIGGWCSCWGFGWIYLRAYGLILFVLVLGSLTTRAYANNLPIQLQQPTTILPVSVENKLASAGISSDDMSVLVVRLSDHKPIIAHLNAQDRKPASTQKIIPTVLALKLLGEDFTWHTPVYYKGVLYDGVLYGDLIIKGSGDPNLTYDKLDYLLALVAQKVRHITGDIYIDNSLFSYVGFDGYQFDGQGAHAYNASPSAFLVNFGAVEIRFLPSGVMLSGADKSFVPNHGRAALKILPAMDEIHLNQASKHSAGARLSFARYQNKCSADCCEWRFWCRMWRTKRLAQF